MENAHAFFARAGITLLQPGGGRDYRGTVPELPGVEIAYLSTADIVTNLAQGAIHLGVTGEDLVREMIADADARVVLLDGLGFGNANVVVAVPQAWIDVRTMRDLDDVATAFHHKRGRRVRVATKYVNLTRGFFSRHGIADYRIVESLGRHRRRTCIRHRRTDRRHHHHRLDAGRQRAEGGRRRRHAALAGQPGGVAAGRVGRRRARHRPRAARPHRRRAPRPHHARGPHPLPRGRRRNGRRGQGPLRRARPARRADLVGHAHAACARPTRCTCLATFLREHGAEHVMVAAPEYVFARENPLFDKLAERLG